MDEQKLDITNDLIAILGEKGVLTVPGDTLPYLRLA